MDVVRCNASHDCIFFLCSADYGTAAEEEDTSEESEDDRKPTVRKGKMCCVKEEDKKPVRLDVLGYPNGSMMPVLAEDVKRYSKFLDPTSSWDGQPVAEKKLFYKRLYRGEHKQDVLMVLLYRGEYE